MKNMTTDAVAEVAKGIWSLPVPLPEASRPTMTNVYALSDDDGALHLVDAGWDTPEAWEALAGGLRAIGHVVQDVRSVTVTHLHRDHRGLTDRLRKASGAVIGMHAQDVAAQAFSREASEADLDGWGVPEAARPALRTAAPVQQPPSAIDKVLHDGDRLDIPGREARIIHTPGHTSGSVCLALPAESVVLTGDHVLPDQFPGIGLGARNSGRENPLHEYFRSLERLASLGQCLALPGHGRPIADLDARIQQILRHHVQRTAELRQVRANQPGASVWQIAEAVTWSAGWDGLSPWHRISALRQTEMHLTGP